MKKTKTQEIIDNINGNGGFDNFNHWNLQEVTEWVKNSYNCRRDVARRVAIEII